ncbi:MAG: tRNA lysidine(34) synthetase TilS [Angelakisella sp.]
MPCLPRATGSLSGVSGGADSVALLRLSAVLREEYRWELIVCHIHHGLRGAEADRDEQFVGELARQLGLPYAVRHIDAAALALENHLSVEEAGRDARYAFFAETAGEGGRVATAHTLDDTIETVLMNLIRGTGLHGLCGIPRIRGNIVRPLLDVTRAEVEEYLALLGQPYCTDSTNLSDDYTRNRVRHDILPRLRELNPNFTGAMARMLPQLAAQWGLTEQLAESAARRLQGAVAGGTLDRQGLLALPEPVCDRLLLRLLEQHGLPRSAAVLARMKETLPLRRQAGYRRAGLVPHRRGQLGALELPAAGGHPAGFGAVPLAAKGCHSALWPAKTDKTDALQQNSCETVRKI